MLEQVAGAAKLLHILNTGARPAVELFANLVSLCGSFSHCGGLHGHTLWLGFRLQPELQNMFRCQELQENLPIASSSILPHAFRPTKLAPSGEVTLRPCSLCPILALGTTFRAAVETPRAARRQAAAPAVPNMNVCSVDAAPAESCDGRVPCCGRATGAGARTTGPTKAGAKATPSALAEDMTQEALG